MLTTLIGDVSLPSFDLGNLLTGGGFGALVWWLVARQGPRQQEEWQKEMAAARQEFAEIMAEERNHRAKITNLLLVMLSAAMTSPAIRDNPGVKAALDEFARESTTSVAKAVP